MKICKAGILIRMIMMVGLFLSALPLMANPTWNVLSRQTTLQSDSAKVQTFIKQIQAKTATCPYRMKFNTIPAGLRGVILGVVIALLMLLVSKIFRKRDREQVIYTFPTNNPPVMERETIMQELPPLDEKQSSNIPLPKPNPKQNQVSTVVLMIIVAVIAAFLKHCHQLR